MSNESTTDRSTPFCSKNGKSKPEETANQLHCNYFCDLGIMELKK